MFDYRAFAMEFDKKEPLQILIFLFIPILLEKDITYVTPSIVFTFEHFLIIFKFRNIDF